MNADPNELEVLALEFRRRIEQREREGFPLNVGVKFPAGCCGDASMLLAQYLRDRANCDCEYVSGTLGKQTHAWLETNAVRVDITVDQFHNHKNVPARFVTQGHPFYLRFTNQEREESKWTKWDARTRATLEEFYAVMIAE